MLPDATTPDGATAAFDAPPTDGPRGDAPADADADASLDAGSALLTGCVMWLRMDEPSWSGIEGEVIDSSGSGNHGTALSPVDGARTALDPSRGAVGRFAAGGCVRVPNNSTLGAIDGTLTMSAWIHPTGLDATNPFGIIAKRTDYLVEDAFDMFVQSENRLFVDIETSNDRFGSDMLVNGVWQQVTVTYDGGRARDGRVRVFLDGVLRDVALETSDLISPQPSDVWVGCLPLGAVAFSFVGDLDDVALWKRALSDEEVLAWYSATR